MAATSARYALDEVLPGSGTAQLIPADRPFVGDYRTEYETIFARRGAPLGLKQIHEVLPLRKKLVDARADAVVAATSSLREQQRAFSDGQTRIGVNETNRLCNRWLSGNNGSCKTDLRRFN